MAVPAKVSARVTAGLKKFQPILQAAKTRDVNESDTVVIITDVLHEVFGYDKYSEITSEHMIRGTFVDLAIKIDGVLQLLIEVKAIGLELKDAFVKQAVDYAANQGVDWVVLTNGVTWKVFKVVFAKPLEHELVVEFNLLDLSHKSDTHLELLWLLAKEGWQKARIGEYHSQKQALSRFSLAAVVLSDAVVEVIRREIRRVSPGIRIDSDEIRQVLQNEVIKREVQEGDKAELARKQLNKAVAKQARAARPAAAEAAEAPSVIAGEEVAEVIVPPVAAEP